MAMLRHMLLGLALMVPVPARAETVANWRPYSLEAARRFAIPLPWIERVMRIESAGRTRRAGRPVTSKAGAMGLMQLMPATWSAMRQLLGLGDDPYDPHDNILAGAFYLRLMYDRFGYPDCFGAYNAGPGRYGAYRAGRRPLPAETIAYLAQVADARVPASRPFAWVEPGLFIPIAAAPERTRSEARHDVSKSSLFAVAPRQ